MLLLLICYAFFIIMAYFYYVAKILTGKAALLELMIMDYFLQWIITSNFRSKGKYCLYLAVSFSLEGIYLLLALFLIKNPGFMMFTIFLLSFEIVHLVASVHSVYEFFKNRRPFKKIFDFRIERCSALFLFTHALVLVLFILYM
ncbi:MAG: hypothetical protein LBR98_04690 [Syntrophomonadaceae bacterium]|jgi:hypothetical protein|nr:hypothetical protein [Syntrophomonadaceae bacterium]